MRCKSLFLSGLLSFGLCGALLSAPAQAQPDENNAPKGDNPPNWNWNPGGGRGGNRGGGRPLQLTADQIRQLREQRMEARTQAIQQRLTGAGFTDATLQTAVVNEYKAQDTAQSDLLEKWQKIKQALLVNQTPAADLTAMLKDFRDAAAKEKVRRATAAAALEAQFQVSQKPVLDALLMTMGITGDEADLVAQTNVGNGLGQILTLPGMAGLANGGLLGNGGIRTLPLPQVGALNGPIVGGDPAGNNGAAGNGMPNGAPRANDRVFF